MKGAFCARDFERSKTYYLAYFDSHNMILNGNPQETFYFEKAETLINGLAKTFLATQHGRRNPHGRSKTM